MNALANPLRMFGKKRDTLEHYRHWVAQVSEAAKRAARGDLEARVLGCHSGDELEELVHRFNHLLDVTDAFVREGHAALKAASEERFHRTLILRGMPGTFREAAVLINAGVRTLHENCDQIAAAEAERLETADLFENTIESVVAVVASSATELQATASNMVETAKATSGQTDTVANTAHAIATNVQSVAAATEELHASVDEIGRQVEHSVRITQDTVREAQGADRTMSELKAASLQINQAVKLISDVAKQTNLLALNAAIEAARMGAAGRGFAVVASEVKNLALQTASATKQVASMVAAIQAAATQGVDAIERVSKSIRGMESATGSIEHSIEEQRQANAEISKNVSQAAAGTEEVSASVHEVASANKETASSAKAVHDTASEVSRQAETLHAASRSLLTTIRTGHPKKKKLTEE